MKPSEMRAEIERLQRLVNRKQATINRLTDSRNKWRDLAQLRWWLDPPCPPPSPSAADLPPPPRLSPARS